MKVLKDRIYTEHRLSCFCVLFCSVSQVCRFLLVFVLAFINFCSVKFDWKTYFCMNLLAHISVLLNRKIIKLVLLSA